VTRRATSSRSPTRCSTRATRSRWDATRATASAPIPAAASGSAAGRTSLPHGQITVEGPFYDNRDSLLSIIGGTGAYRDAHGQMLLHARSDGYDFVFSID
jgi:hypothetical protein